MRLICKVLKLPHSSYYKWLNRKESRVEKENYDISRLILDYHDKFNNILGYRRMTLFINRLNQKNYNEKRIRRIMKMLGISSKIRRKRKGYIKVKPQITAENILNRKFSAEQPNEKWLTDVTEFKIQGSDKKICLSAIFDLYDKSIVSYVISRFNNNKIVFDTFDLAVKSNPSAKPLFHSDRGYQYTSKVFHTKLTAGGMTQSMSRVGRCIDNGPMEGFFGTLKTEMYYLNTFQTEKDLRRAIFHYIEFYNNQRFQENLKGMTPIEFRNHASLA